MKRTVEGYVVFFKRDPSWCSGVGKDGWGWEARSQRSVVVGYVHHENRRRAYVPVRCTITFDDAARERSIAKPAARRKKARRK